MNGVNKVMHHLATEQVRTGNDVEVWGLTKNGRRPEYSHRGRVFCPTSPAPEDTEARTLGSIARYAYA